MLSINMPLTSLLLGCYVVTVPRALGLCCAQVPAPRRGTPPAIVIPRAPAPRRRGTAVPTPLLPVRELHSDTAPTQGSGKRRDTAQHFQGEDSME